MAECWGPRYSIVTDRTKEVGKRSQLWGGQNYDLCFGQVGLKADGGTTLGRNPIGWGAGSVSKVANSWSQLRS